MLTLMQAQAGPLTASIASGLRTRGSVIDWCMLSSDVIHDGSSRLICSWPAISLHASAWVACVRRLQADALTRHALAAGRCKGRAQSNW